MIHSIFVIGYKFSLALNIFVTSSPVIGCIWFRKCTFCGYSIIKLSCLGPLGEMETVTHLSSW